MIRGIDVGNYSLKIWPDTCIKSLVTGEENILGSKLLLELNGKKHVIGEGVFETELNKSCKENFIPLLMAGIAISSKDVFNQIVVGLPINQYKKNKEELERLILNNRVQELKLNGEIRKVIVTDFKVYPEGIGAYYSLNTSEDVIIIDIGGRTTDIVYVAGMKNEISSTVAVGTLNIYKDVADQLNSLYGLDLNIQMIDRIIERGFLKVDGLDVDLRFIVEILKKNFSKIKEDLDMKFPARSEQIVLVGGGAKLFEKAFKNRYKNCEVSENPLFANAIGFQKVGEQLWG